ncbi:MAG: hypothetical protein R8J94_20440 [Acidimicrobiia bacterium]|nr:hypothetical protein [Acidimicrobiia bacterium]
MSSSSRGRIDPLKLETPEGYEAWTADQKQRWLWSTLIGTTAHTSTSIPSLVLPFKTSPLREMSIIVKRDELDKALTRSSDLMEPGRPKVIHARGAVAKVTFEPADDSPFSGLLGPPPQGGAAGLLRLSLVAKVDRNAAFTPALALKLLIDGRPSADVLAMNHTVGQGRDFNLFSNTMTNDLTSTHNELRPPQRVMSWLFARISRAPRRMVSTHLAEHDRTGNEVGEVLAPDRLIFRPTDAAKQSFAGQAGVDFRLVLAEIPEGTELFAVDGITSAGTVQIGSVKTSSRFVSSDGGDRLFFRHVHDPADLKTY